MDKNKDKRTSVAEDPAQKRTILALERTQMARERTFAAWVRTGLAPLAIGLGLVKLMPDASPRWLIQVLGILLVLSGLYIFITGYRTYERVLLRLQQEGYEGLPISAIKGMTVMLLLAGVLALLLIIID